MFEKLQEINRRPKPFEFYTTEELWNDPYISGKMLEMHLAENVDAASRSKEFLEKSVEWLAAHFGIGKDAEICDFGCGPGLYTTPLAEKGAVVTGIDFSKRSIGHAQKVAEQKKLNIDYVYRNYLEYSTEKRFDLIIMIFCDFCVLNPQQRKKLLSTFRELLKKDGSLFFDVFSHGFFNGAEEGVSFEYSETDGFWSPGPYYAFKNTIKYEEEKLYLDKYTIIEKQRTRESYNWLQCYSLETLEKELSENGFRIHNRYSNAAGEPYSPDSTEIAIAAGLA